MPEDFLSRTRASYDTLASAYAERFRSELAAKPLDRAVLGGFAELVKAADLGPVADIGCGTGRITAYLHTLGLSVFGIDLSPEMVSAARGEHPHLRFQQGSMTELELQNNSLGGIVAWYSIIHIPDEDLLDVFAQFCRVLAPGAPVLLSFAVGDEALHRHEVGGHEVSLDFHPRQPDTVTDLLAEAGLSERARLVRQPDEEGEFREWVPQSYLLARKPRVTA